MEETFITEYLRHTSIYESPNSFWKWSSYATIAAILRDNCYLLQGDDRLYPNIYVLFLAESGVHRKGKPVGLSESLVFKVNNTKIISGRSSIQAILDELAHVETDKKTGKITKAGSAIFYAPELAAGIVADPAALEILTDIYDYKANPYKSRLRTGPCFNLERIVLNLFAASNEAMIKEFFNAKAIQGGMLARTFLVTPNEFRPSNSLMGIDPLERKASIELVLKPIYKIAELKGAFNITMPAREEYESWYKKFRDQNNIKKDSSGIVGRVHTSVIKLAMILAANDLSLDITKEHMESAIQECLSLMPNYSIFTMNNTKSELSQAGGLVITELSTCKEFCLPRKEILRRHWQNGVDADLLEKVLVTLEQAGMVQQLQTREGSFVSLTKQCLEMLGLKVQK